MHTESSNRKDERCLGTGERIWFIGLLMQCTPLLFSACACDIPAQIRPSATFPPFTGGLWGVIEIPEHHDLSKTILTISIPCAQFFNHAVFDVVVDACPEQSRRDEI